MGFPEQPDKLQRLDSFNMLPSFKINLGGVEFKADDKWAKVRDHEYSVNVGRNTDSNEPNKIELTGNMDVLDGVSRNQFRLIVKRISKTESEYYIKDLRSSNGTFLNAVRLPPDENFLITEGDVISIGKASTIIDLEVKFVNGCLVLNQI